MIIERTNNVEIVRRVMTNPAVYPYISDDGCPLVEYFKPIESDEIYYLLVLDENRMVHGLYVLHAMNYITYEIHTCLLNSCRGKMALEAAKSVLKWIITNTPCLKVITNVPENNRFALNYAQKAGFIIEGINRQSFMKGGKLYNQTMLGITRKEICQPQS